MPANVVSNVRIQAAYLRNNYNLQSSSVIGKLEMFSFFIFNYLVNAI